jgi:hypothetical protein
VPRTNLLLISKNGVHHYTLIRDLSRMLYDENKHRGRSHFCERCLTPHSTAGLLEKHLEGCKGVDGTPTRVGMPEEGKNTPTFTNHQKQLPTPYVIYADANRGAAPTHRGPRA